MIVLVIIIAMMILVGTNLAFYGAGFNKGDEFARAEQILKETYDERTTGNHSV